MKEPNPDIFHALCCPKCGACLMQLNKRVVNWCRTDRLVHEAYGYQGPLEWVNPGLSGRNNRAPQLNRLGISPEAQNT